MYVRLFFWFQLARCTKSQTLLPSKGKQSYGLDLPTRRHLGVLWPTYSRFMHTSGLGVKLIRLSPAHTIPPMRKCPESPHLARIKDLHHRDNPYIARNVLSHDIYLFFDSSMYVATVQPTYLQVVHVVYLRQMFALS
jgi:hypothetical protein